eukprot:jgi/Mesen1/10000/ME000072S09413
MLACALPFLSLLKPTPLHGIAPYGMLAENACLPVRDSGVLHLVYKSKYLRSKCRGLLKCEAKTSNRKVGADGIRLRAHELELKVLIVPSTCTTTTGHAAYVISKDAVDDQVSPISSGQIPTCMAGDQRGKSQSSLNISGVASDKVLPMTEPSLLVFSGGTAFNGVVGELKQLTTHVAHVLPVSDDGGSTAEIVRVLGGPAIGDIRSRCLRLSDDSTAEALAVKQLLGHRLSRHSADAKAEWYRIVEGEHTLWDGVSEPYRDTIRGFLVHFQHQAPIWNPPLVVGSNEELLVMLPIWGVVRSSSHSALSAAVDGRVVVVQILQHATEGFNFQNGSVGNFLFTGARTFFRSLDAAIFLFSRVSHIPPTSLVLPAIRTNDRLTMGAELQDGTIIRGQNEISHPGWGCASPSPGEARRHSDKSEGSLVALPSPVKRIFYMASEGTYLLDEVYPQVNPTVVEKLGCVDALVYGMGSLYTSICPSLVLRGVGEAIASRKCPKILLLNGTHDRETGGMSAADCVRAITDALNRCYTKDLRFRLYHPLMADSVKVDSSGTLFDAKALINALKISLAADVQELNHVIT